jgi:ATP-dependent Lon protease
METFFPGEAARMPRHYNLRRRNRDVKWIEDDTLKTKEETESEEEDEDYEPPVESEDEEEEEEEDDEEEESEEEEEEEEEDSPAQQSITIPVSKHGFIKIEIDNRPVATRMQLEDDDDEMEEEEEEEDEFIDYLMNKYVPHSKLQKKSKKEKEPDEPALDLNDEEQEYFDELSRSKQKKLNKQMKEVSALVSSNGVPTKFRILDLPVTEAVKAAVIKKVNMLNEMDPDTGEVYKLRTWVDGFMRLPFGKQVELPVKIDDGAKPCAAFLAETRVTLDKAVYGMNGAKTQIMQILAQWISNPSSVGNVIALKGPMGVGKTSFAKNGVAGALKRPFEFFSLGGAADSANFVGHSYTYEGAVWGRIADSLMTAKCMNPVMYFDELDKVSTTAHGEEIVSMLIHMTDRSQNSQFHDRYFAGVDIDLSQCLFVFSFNDESKVHPILKDRMQVIHCAGYTSDEKKVILTQYVWPQILERIKLEKELTISDEAIKHLISEYSSEEEGVRTLMRAVETLVTRINLLRIADEDTAKSYKFYTKVKLPLTIDVETAKHILQDTSPQVNESWRHLYV